MKGDLYLKLCHSLEEGIKGSKNIILHLSGGCDSAALFYCLTDIMGNNFTCSAYVFDPKSKDLYNTRLICESTGIKLKEYHMTFDDVLSNIQELKDQYGIVGQVNLQVIAGLFQVMKTERESLFINGSGADVLYGWSYRTVSIIGHNNHEAFDEERKKMLKKMDLEDHLGRIAERYNNKIFYPFLQTDVVNYFMNEDWMKLKNKKIFWEEFGDLLPKGHKVSRISQQIASGIRDKLKQEGIKRSYYYDAQTNQPNTSKLKKGLIYR